MKPQAINVSDYLPLDQIHELAQAADGVAKPVKHQGRLPGSLEDDSTAGLDYRVMDGLQLAEKVPWILDVYRDPYLLAILSFIAESQLAVSPDELSSVNINVLEREGQRYEKHIDGWGYTLVCFLTEKADAGGHLVVHDGHEVYRLPPVQGEAYLISGAESPDELVDGLVVDDVL